MKSTFKRGGCKTFAKWRNLKSEWLSSTSVRKECLPSKETHEDFIETLRKESPSYSTVEKWAAEFKRGRMSIEEDGWSGRPKDATHYENVKVEHTLVMCDRRQDLQSIGSEVGISFGTVQSIHLRYAKGFGKMGAVNVDQ